mmetsp:Transcript_15289/g.19583  ORF Transcript_15289/g.19583 Transcript_15289/m.19583 type:complete len:695 (+) Transcript_15289:110-2194(+)
MNEYIKIREIGRGAQGTVNLVKDKSKQPRKYVVKEIPINILSPEERESTLRESQFLKSLVHPNIVEYVDSFVEGDFMYMVMSFCAGGDLNMHIRKKSKDGGLFEETQIMDWFVQICGAMQFVHSRHILHRDLKTNNIFLTDRNVVKLGDFGIARILETTLEKADTVVGTPFYMSPEVCENQPYDYKSDVWAMGCILYEMCTLVHAFKANNLLGIVFKIVQGEYSPISDEYSDGLKRHVDWLLAKEPEKRPTVKEILASDFVTEHIEVFMKTGGGTMGKEIPQLVRKAKEMGARRAKAASNAEGGRRRSRKLEPNDEFAGLSHKERLKRLKEKRLAKEEAQKKAELERAYLESASGREAAKSRQLQEFGQDVQPRVGTAPRLYDDGRGGDTFDTDAKDILLSKSAAPDYNRDMKGYDPDDYEDSITRKAGPVHGRGYQDLSNDDTYMFSEAKSIASNYKAGLKYSDDELEESMGGESHLLEPRQAKSPNPYDERPITSSGGYNLDQFGEGAYEFEVEGDEDIRGDEGSNPYGSDDDHYSSNFESDSDDAEYTIRPNTSADPERQAQRDEEHNQEMAEVLARMRNLGAAEEENGPSQKPPATPPHAFRAHKGTQNALASRVRDARRRNIENLRVRLITELGRQRFQTIYEFFRKAHADGTKVEKPEVLRLVGGNRELVKKANDVESLICLEELYCG